MSDQQKRMPVLFFSHGPGPAWLLDDNFILEQNKDCPEAQFLREFRARYLGDIPPIKAILVVSAHWETPQITVQSVAQPSLYHDFDPGCPPESYEVRWPVSGSPEFASRAKELLEAADIPVKVDTERGLDHGVFVPLMLVFGDTDIPVFQVSINSNWDISAHLSLGEALAPLRDDGVLLVGSGFTVHRAQFDRPDEIPDWAEDIKTWTHTALLDPTADRDQRKATLCTALDQPSFAHGHRTPEHFMPIPFVSAAAGYSVPRVVYERCVLGGLYVCHYVFDN